MLPYSELRGTAGGPSPANWSAARLLSTTERLQLVGPQGRIFRQRAPWVDVRSHRRLRGTRPISRRGACRRRKSSPICGSSAPGAPCRRRSSKGGWGARIALAAANAPDVPRLRRGARPVRAGHGDRHRRVKPGGVGRRLLRGSHRARPGNRHRRVFGHAPLSASETRCFDRRAPSACQRVHARASTGTRRCPMWSSVQVHGMGEEELMRRPYDGCAPWEPSPRDFRAICIRERAARMVTELLRAGQVAEAFHAGGNPRARCARNRQTVRDPSFRQQNRAGDRQRDGRSGQHAAGWPGGAGRGAGHVGRETSMVCSGPLGVPVVAGANGISRVVEIPLYQLRSAAEFDEHLASPCRQQVQTWMSDALTPSTVTVQ